ncbi:MAG: glycosyltransferase family 4 protein [Actinomycetaceae bacterium]|nr:glycosyltransferase family 4 protein [Actinomycetaceae bacterium]
MGRNTQRRRPRIVVTVTVDSTLSFTQSLVPRLVECGWEVHLVTTPGPNLEAYQGREGVYIHPLPMHRAPHPNDILSLGNWLRLLRRVQPDVIYAASPKASMLSMVAGRIVGVPVRVYAILGLRLETATGTLLEVLKRTEKLTTQSATHVLSVSKSISEALPKYGINVPTHIIGNGSLWGIDLTRFTETEREFNPQAPVVGFVGRLDRDKGISELVAAFSQILEEIPQAHLLLGGPDEGMAHLLQTLPAGSYTWLGRVEDPREVHHHCDVFCLPTYREGFGMVVTEAQACGVPVVGTDATGVIDAVDYGRAGRVAKAKDAQSLYRELMVVLTDPDERQRLREAGLLWSKHFDRVELTRKTEEWLRQLLIDSQRQ